VAGSFKSYHCEGSMHVHICACMHDIVFLFW